MLGRREAVGLGVATVLATAANFPTVGTGVKSAPAVHAAQRVTSTLRAPAATSRPAGAVFVDRFERGDMSSWYRVRRITAQRQVVFDGRWSARAESGGKPAFARKKLRTARRDLVYGLRFKILRQGDNRVTILTTRTREGGALVRLYVSAAGMLGRGNEVTDRSRTSSRRVNTTWHRLQLRVHVAGTGSRATVWMDGKRVPSLSGRIRLKGAGVAQLQIGADAADRGFAIAFDNVVAARPGLDTSSPTAPRDVAAQVRPNLTRVDVSWSAARDDVRVVGYDVFRNGQRVARLGNRTSYGDTGVRTSGRYVYRVRARDAAGNISPLSAPATATLPHPVIAAAGDIACSPGVPQFNDGRGTPDWCRQMATSDLLLDDRIDRVLPLGDAQYEEGTLEAFRRSYDPSWGRVKSITSPVAGNHEYRTPRAEGYFDYFGAAAGARGKGYYSYNLGRWHLVALNSQCGKLPAGSALNGCAEGSPQNNWLEADLAAHRTSCTLAYWHIPPNFSATEQSNDAAMVALWRDLHAAGADVALVGHRHTYARYAPRGADGLVARTGIRQFVVGTGGKNHGESSVTQPAAVEVRDDETFGVLEMTLRPGSYGWRFVPEAGGTFRDSGSTSCR